MVKYKEKSQEEIQALFNKRFIYEDERHLYEGQAILRDFLKYAKEDKLLLNESFPYYPQIINEMMPTCIAIGEDIAKDSKNRGTCNIRKDLMATFRFCFYASAAAVILDEKDTKGLYKKGIYKTMVQPRGIYYMDEYCSDVMGLPWGSDGADDLLHLTMNYCYLLYICTMRKGRTQISALQYRECMYAMYMLGIAYGHSLLLERGLGSKHVEEECINYKQYPTIGYETVDKYVSRNYVSWDVPKPDEDYETINPDPCVKYSVEDVEFTLSESPSDMFPWLREATRKKGETFGEKLRTMLGDRNIPSSQFCRDSLLSRQWLSNVISNNVKPTKGNALAACIGLKLDVNEAAVLLDSAGYTFSNSDVTDLIVRCYIEHKVYNIDEINGYLVSEALKPLGSRG